MRIAGQVSKAAMRGGSGRHAGKHAAAQVPARTSLHAAVKGSGLYEVLLEGQSVVLQRTEPLMLFRVIYSRDSKIDPSLCSR